MTENVDVDLMARVLDVTDSRQFLVVTLRVSGGLVGFVEVGEAAASRALTHVEDGIVPRVAALVRCRSSFDSGNRE